MTITAKEYHEKATKLLSSRELATEKLNRLGRKLSALLDLYEGAVMQGDLKEAALMKEKCFLVFNDTLDLIFERGCLQKEADVLSQEDIDYSGSIGMGMFERNATNFIDQLLKGAKEDGENKNG